MKALKIYEFENFKRGQNPHHALSIGDGRDWKIIATELVNEIFDTHYEFELTTWHEFESYNIYFGGQYEYGLYYTPEGSGDGEDIFPGWAIESPLSKVDFAATGSLNDWNKLRESLINIKSALDNE